MRNDFHSERPVRRLRPIVFLLIWAVPVALFASPADRKIEEATRASFNYRTVLARQVHIEARSGIVTLTGTVEDDDERALAAATVADFPEIIRVDNDISVQPSVVIHSDAWIAMKVRRKLLVKADVIAEAITVDVRDGVVTLTGTVSRQSQKVLPEIYAQDIGGVRVVRNELLVSEPAVASTVLRETVDDLSITTQVRLALATSGATSALILKVSTTNGVVAVSGEAPSNVEKALVTKVAEGVRGVQSVSNNMSVKT